ncbi:Ribose-5-phosphate isomerase A [Planctomycetes bacterium Poly30]|uniref:Ribose-5-phosphate isomerase A n=1 Tax=Saltatorellus ferox TaxID=2528018 RepID=A0A518F0X0_9BACT|nr:Ribose-5-phosphate isomerase A [Planctomycetes bacterium Poly30]
MSESKRAAGRRAAEFIESGQTVGLGTGSTVFFTLERLAERIRDEGLEIRGVPTSIDTETKSRGFGIPLATLDEVEKIDVTVDGADEIDGAFQMIKGGGGALLREKVVASLSDRVVIVVGADKVVERLGSTFDLPVEVVPFARAVVHRRIEAMGGQPALRMRKDDSSAAYLTDNGNEILDVHHADGIADAAALERALHEIPGVVESGLFIGLAHAMVVGEADGSASVHERG